ncbi:hypothetical protein NUW87_11530, partial [Corynebacterium pilbarense]
MSSRNRKSTGPQTETEKATDTNPKAHPLVGNPPPLSPVQTTPNNHPVNKESDSNRTPERRSHLPKVHTGQTEGHRSIEELAGEKGGCKVSLTKTQPTPTKNPTRTTPPTRVVQTKHPTPHILPVMNARDSIR